MSVNKFFNSTGLPTAVTLPAATETAVINDLIMGGKQSIGFTVVNTGGTNALTGAKIYVKRHPSFDYVEYTGADLSTADGTVVVALTTSIKALAVGASADVVVNIGACYSIKITLTSTSGTTVKIGGSAG